ncbi:hypothetical protein GUITHDRAFT_166896 [Guillardia theta CCMP2712]|uniref:Uncharacterized protein n=3 Tax=Guillardia theta TaxID=55529 RepID=L1I528_GUITC|nr:hypothetical protein GUITHDRAFT_166896 [Guillardia theta CCMP2712]EKX31368.1 hypothetical protein GUITHDRAFT_166896 [Guillardia theta CCMP2712]|eukprot:XP_005818348.1 hypothetical protein GUITHDRAFT_166896 [Guillardia theta CCMP2712]
MISSSVKSDVKERREKIDQATAKLEDAEALKDLAQLNDEVKVRAQLRQARSLVLFADWKLGAEMRSAYPENHWEERLLVKQQRKDSVRSMAASLGQRDEELEKKSRAKEDADQKFLKAEQLVQQGLYPQARELLEEVEGLWRLAGMLGFPGRPFESAIEDLLAKIDSAAKDGKQQLDTPMEEAQATGESDKPVDFNKALDELRTQYMESLDRRLQ